METPISITSCAKINLGLKIGEERPDGYHNLETVFQTISLQDDIRLEDVLTGGISVHCSHPDVPEDTTNLCHRAALVLREKTGTTRGARIAITKRIPVGAGLGGGSSNAAAVLKGLNSMWHTGLRENELERLGASLGADVPFFIKGGTALARGTGDKLTPVPSRESRWVVVAYPPVKISTSWAYKNLRIDLTAPGKNIKLTSFLKEGLDAFLRDSFNDFEALVFEKYPVTAMLKRSLLAEGAQFALLSGSGSAVFGIFPDQPAAAAAAASLEDGTAQFFLARFVNAE